MKKKAIIGIRPNAKVIEALRVTLANSYALYLKTQNYHWNVTGNQFSSLHLLFEKQYTDLAEAIDEIAERIRALDCLAPGSFEIFNNMKDIKDAIEGAASDHMLKDLRDDTMHLAEMLKEGVSIAQKHNDEATADLFIERIRVHEKNAWMLNSSLQK